MNATRLSDDVDVAPCSVKADASMDHPESSVSRESPCWMTRTDSAWEKHAEGTRGMTRDDTWMTTARACPLDGSCFLICIK